MHRFPGEHTAEVDKSFDLTSIVHDFIQFCDSFFLGRGYILSFGEIYEWKEPLSTPGADLRFADRDIWLATN